MDATPEDLGLALASFTVLGDYAAAGLEATRLVLAVAQSSHASGRIPIAGALVTRREDGTLVTVTTGCNGRIPAADDSSNGYPSDHGETGALRAIGDFAAVDWSRSVFATSLSPCVMCTRTLVHLHGLGLRRIVVAESSSFPGRKDLLRPLDGMQLVELTNAGAIKLMEDFARRYPWDWAADIGEVPPCASVGPPVDLRKLGSSLAEQPGAATVVAATGAVVASASDERAATGGNPVQSACMRAFGLAGSTVNLRECTVIVEASGGATVESFGLSSLGACELFRPRCVAFSCCGGCVADDLAAALGSAGIEVKQI